MKGFFQNDDSFLSYNILQVLRQSEPAYFLDVMKTHIFWQFEIACLDNLITKNRHESVSTTTLVGKTASLVEFHFGRQIDVPLSQRGRHAQNQLFAH